jgi:pimeloyl-ACP methyl ester carboxylesterase
MRRVLIVLVLLLAAAIALPPLWFRAFPAKLPALAPPETFVALASGPRMHAIVRGEGPAVVLVHGLPGQASEWRATTELLAAHGRRVVAIDRLGYGHSDARDGDEFTLESNARELRELLDALDLADVTVVGWSYGGGTALVAAHQQASNPESRARIARLVLVGSVGPMAEASGPPAAVRILFSGPVLRWVRSIPPLGLGVQRAMSANAYSEQPMPGWWLPGLAANLAQPKTQIAFAREGARMPQGPAAPDSAGLELPILVVHGDDDRLVPVEAARTLVRNNPRAELLEVAGGSHMLPITHAALLADRIASFSAPPAPAAPAAPPGADAGAPVETPEHWMDALAAR